MAGAYERQTDRRSREERRLSVRAVHRERTDLNLLTELLIRFSLQDSGARRADASGDQVFDTGREAPSVE